MSSDATLLCTVDTHNIGILKQDVYIRCARMIEEITLTKCEIVSTIVATNKILNMCL